MKRFHDFIIVGSGAGGSVLGHFLTQAGADVLMLEAGKRFSAETFPANEMDANAQLIWGPDLKTDNTILCRVTVVDNAGIR